MESPVTDLPVQEGLCITMAHEYTIRRYAAYFRGWCQAFGEHQSVTDEATGISWLFNESQVGFILPGHLTKSLHREVLGRNKNPILHVSGNTARVGTVDFVLPDIQQIYTQGEIRNVLNSSGESCLFLTSHFMYGTGTRIITLSGRKPLPIIYKEIGSMKIRLE